MRPLLLLAALALLTVSGPAVAHHSFAVHFVADKQISVTGIVKEFRFANPHGVLYFEAKNEAGVIEDWKAETNAPSLLARRGWKRDSMKAGDHITVVGWPARDGSNMMRIDKIVFSDGKVLSSRPGTDIPKD